MVHHHSSVMVDPAPHNLFGWIWEQQLIGEKTWQISMLGACFFFGLDFRLVLDTKCVCGELSCP
jgi:hypothetical protein